MKFIYLIAILLVSLAVGCEYAFSPDDGPKLIQRVELRTERFDDTIYIYRTGSSSTVEDAIFIRKSPDENFASHIFERYDSLVNFNIGVDSLTLVLFDTEQVRKSSVKISLKELTE